MMLSRWCACGAQWHGKTVAAAKAIIKMHHRRGGACWKMSHGAFKHTYRCGCDACRTERRAAWKAKRLAGRRER